MTPYSFPPIDYKGQQIDVKATTNAGSVATPSGTAQTTALRFYLDDELKMVVSVTTDAIATQYASGVQVLKDEIDNLDEAAKILIELGATKDDVVDTVATPTGFESSRSEDDGIVKLQWNVVDPVQIYEIEVDDNAEFSSPTNIFSGDLLPLEVGVLPAGAYYFRIRARISGMADSGWATTSIIVP